MTRNIHVNFGIELQLKSRKEKEALEAMRPLHERLLAQLDDAINTDVTRDVVIDPTVDALNNLGAAILVRIKEWRTGKSNGAEAQKDGIDGEHREEGAAVHQQLVHQDNEKNMPRPSIVERKTSIQEVNRKPSYAPGLESVGTKETWKGFQLPRIAFSKVQEKDDQPPVDPIEDLKERCKQPIRDLKGCRIVVTLFITDEFRGQEVSECEEAI